MIQSSEYKELMQSNIRTLERLQSCELIGNLVHLKDLGFTPFLYKEIWPGIRYRLIKGPNNLITVQEFNHARVMPKLNWDKTSNVFFIKDPEVCTDWHYHHERETIRILEGSMTLYLKDNRAEQSLVIEPGGSFVVERMQPHRVETGPGCFGIVSVWPALG